MCNPIGLGHNIKARSHTSPSLPPPLPQITMEGPPSTGAVKEDHRAVSWSHKPVS